MPINMRRSAFSLFLLFSAPMAQAMASMQPLPKIDIAPALLAPRPAAPNPSLSQIKFDLDCTGSLTLSNLDFYNRRNNNLEIIKDFPQHYRIDLQDMKWCAGDCSDAFRIEMVSNKFIILLARDSPQHPFNYTDIFLNRYNGYLESNMHYSNESGDSKVLFLGKCVKSDFSGFPEVKF